MNVRTKKRIKIAGWTCLFPVTLLALAMALLYVPPVQRMVVRKASHAISASTGMRVEVGGVRLTFPLNLTLKDVAVTSPAAAQDTLLFIRQTRLHVRPMPLLDKEISVAGFQMEDVRLSLRTATEGMEITGRIGRLTTSGDRILPAREEARLGRLTLSDAEVTLRISPVASPDTSATDNHWKIWIDDLRLQRASVAVQMPSDAERLATGVERLALTDGAIDFGAKQYSVAHLSLSDATVSYDVGERPLAKGFDPSHIAFSDIQAGMDSLFYQEKEIHACLGACLRTFSAREQSGIAISSMSGTIQADSALLLIPRWSLRTPGSSLSAQVAFPWQLAAEGSKEIFRTQIEASLDRRDVLTLAGAQAPAIAPYYPDALFTVSGLLEGTSARMHLRRLYGELPGVFRMEADGWVDHIADPVARAGKIHLAASTQAGKRRSPFFPSTSLSLPVKMNLDLQVALDQGIYQAEALLTGQEGHASFAGRYHAARHEYEAALTVEGLEPGRFLPADSTVRLTASLTASGKGADVFADSTRAHIRGVLTEFRYKNTTFSGLSVEATLKEHRLQASLASEYPYAKGVATLDGEIYKKKSSAMLIVEMDSLDFYGLNMTDQAFSHSFQLFTEWETNGAKQHRLDMTLGNWDMVMGAQTVTPKTLTLHAHGDADTTLLSFHAGDLAVTLAGNTDPATTVRKLTAVPSDFMRQLREDSLLRLQPLRVLLPAVSLQVTAGRDNPVYHYLQEKNVFFDQFTLDASVSPADGIRMDARLLSFVKDTTKIDTVRVAVWQDTTGIYHSGEVIKNKFRRQEPFTAGWNGDLQDGAGSLEMYYRNGRNETGLHAGVRAVQQPDGVRFHLLPDVVIAFLPFSVNRNNYVLVKNMRDISASLRMKGENGAFIRLHSTEGEEEAMKELSLEINRLNLADVTRGFGDRAPSLQGLADVSLRYVPMDSAYLMVMDAGVDNLIYRDGRIGGILLNGVYLPVGAGEHQIDMHLFHDKKEISMLSALYRPARDGGLEGALEVDHVPLAMFNPFLAGAAQLNGSLQGSLSISGTKENPLLNGYLKMDTTTAYIAAAGTRIRFDEQKVEIKDSRVQFNNYRIHAAGNNPFVINGTIDIHNPARGKADLKLTADNMQLLDTRKTDESIVYGKLFVDLNSTLSGALNSLDMRGDLHLSGNTNLTYILKESPLTAQDRMADLVTFSYFQDTIPRRTRRSYTGLLHETAPTGGLDMQLAVRVDPAVKLRVDLDGEGSNRVELEGGGDLSLQYTRQGDLLLTGRYTLSDGLVKYNMPVIANKTLKVKENSYIEWTGNMMDPYLNLKATERIRSSVGTDGQTPHIVNFDAGIEVKQRMADLSLQFTLDALDDASVQNQLISMGPEERGKQAVSLLLTGMYLADDGNGKKKIDMGTALNSFLQSEINLITGSLLKDVDFNFIMDSYDGADNGKRTDYAFRFSKRFYNERINVILGGLVSTGDVAEQSNTFINDASLEYRLDVGGNRYAKVFYNRQYESLLEGEITKYGAGIIFRKKMIHLYDLFLFRKKQVAPVADEEKEDRHDEKQ
jgi:hypothetical protein